MKFVKLFLSILLVLACSNTFAANVSIRSIPDRYWPVVFENEPNMECISLDGKIEKGDLQKIRRLFAKTRATAANAYAAEIYFLCLNSPGGSFTAAIEIAKFIRDEGYTTRLLANTRCESACALVFMSGIGRYHESSSYGLSRYMHITAKLGFHSPSLLIQKGEYNETAVNRAYKIAVQSISSGISALMVRYGERPSALSPSLLAKMLNTPGDDMFYIETIDQAGRWDIGLVGAKYDAQVTNRNLNFACNNFLQWELGESSINHNLQNFEKSSYTKNNEILYNEMEGTGCRFGDGKAKLVSEISDAYIYGGSEIGFKSAKFLDKTLVYLDPRTKFAGLNKAPLRSNLPQSTGRCTISVGSQFFDNDPCTKSVVNKKVNGVLSAVFTYVWPSGAKTIIVNRRGVMSINGHYTRLTKHQSAKYGECAFNPRKKKLFCYTAE